MPDLPSFKNLTQPVSSIEQAYKSELLALCSSTGSNIYHPNYIHSLTPKGSPKWTLKRKHSFLTQYNNLATHNGKHHKRPRHVPLPTTTTSKTAGIDLLSPTNHTPNWPSTTLNSLLAPPTRAGIPPHRFLSPNSPDAPWRWHAAAAKAYKRARAGLLIPSSPYFPWDYVSLGLPPGYNESAQEKKWWKVQNQPYMYSRSATSHRHDDGEPTGGKPAAGGGKGGTLRKGWKKEWFYCPSLHTWYRQPIILHTEQLFRPNEWLTRFVVRNHVMKAAKLARQFDLTGPRGERRDGGVGMQTPLLHGMHTNPVTGVSSSSSSSSSSQLHPLLDREAIVDEVGLSFVRWRGRPAPLSSTTIISTATTAGAAAAAAAGVALETTTPQSGNLTPRTRNSKKRKLGDPEHPDTRDLPKKLKTRDSTPVFSSQGTHPKRPSSFCN